MLAKNSIKKIILDFEYQGSQGDVFLTNGETSHYFYEILMPVINRLIEQNAPHETITINKLEIELGTASMDDLPRLLEEELLRHLDRYLTTASGSSGAVSSTLKNMAAMLNDVLYFLSYGVFPWHYDLAKGDINSLIARLLKENSALTIEALTKLFVSTPVSLQRFVWQVNPKQLRLVFTQIITGNKYAALLLLWYTYIAQRRAAVLHEAQVSLFRFILANSDSTNEEAYLKLFATTVIAPYFRLPSQTYSRLTSHILKKWKQLQKQDNLSESPANITATLIPRLALWIEKELITTNSKKQFKQQVTAADGEKDRNDNIDNSIDTTTGIYINNAGIVLLNPYLQMFFSRMKLTNDNGFLDFPAQQKATQLLHYLATGSLATPEHLLPLCKIICGLDVYMPVPAKLKLRKGEKEACEVLLQAVINNWAQIKNTSIDGLRGTFLVRDGVLKKDEANWLLHVERKTVDVLVDSLPWQFRLLKFPWNEYIVHVQW